MRLNEIRCSGFHTLKPDLATLPTLNALLNATSAVLLFTGYRFIRRGHRLAHKRTMLAAFCTSAVFLVSYLYYHAHVGSYHFRGHGLVRPIYFTILGTHTFLAAAMVPFILLALTRALRGRFAQHKAVARYAFPVWLYVSITGVVIYLMLYHLFTA